MSCLCTVVWGNWGPSHFGLLPAPGGLGVGRWALRGYGGGLCKCSAALQCVVQPYHPAGHATNGPAGHILLMLMISKLSPCLLLLTHFACFLVLTNNQHQQPPGCEQRGPAADKPWFSHWRLQHLQSDSTAQLCAHGPGRQQGGCWLCVLVSGWQLVGWLGGVLVLWLVDCSAVSGLAVLRSVFCSQ